MKNRQRLGLLILTMTTFSVVVAGTGIYFLYQTALQQEQGRLVDKAKRQARSLEALKGKEENEEALVKTLTETLKASPESSKTGEILLAKRDGDRIVFLLSQRNNQTSTPTPIPLVQQDRAEPTHKAILGESGSLIGQDYRQIEVIAAYEPVADSDLGVVVKIDLDEFRAPFLQIALLGIVAAIVASTLGAIAYLRLSRPMLKELEESERKNRAIVETAADGVIVIDDRAIVETFNSSAEKLFGYSAKQVLGQNIDNLLLSFKEGEVEAALFGTNALKPTPPQNSPESNIQEIEVTPNTSPPTPPLPMSAKRELMGQRQDGTIFPIEIAASRLTKGKFKRYTLIVRDISERKQAEDALKRLNEELELRVEERTTQLMSLNEELLHEMAERNHAEESMQELDKRFRTLFDRSGVGIIQTNKSGQFLKVNPKFSQLLGYSEGELQEKTFQELTHAEDLGNAIAQFRQLVEGDLSHISVEQRYLNKEGAEIWVNLSGSVVRNPMGDVEYFLGVVEDVGDRVAAKSALMATESTLNSFYNSTSMMMGIIELIDNDMRHISDNAVTTEFFRLSPITMHNQLASDMGVPEDIRRYWIDHCNESRQIGKPIQFEYAYEMDVDDGETDIRWLSATVCPIPGQQRFSYMVEDVTERRQQAEALRRTNEELEDSTLELDARRQGMERLGELADFLQASLTTEEAYNVIAELMAPLFPTCSGGVFVLNEGGNLVEAIASWGTHFNSETIFSPEDSWALRRGKVHWVDESHPRLLSKHVHSDPMPAETLSVPLIAQGQTLGLLYLTSPERGILSPGRQQFAQTVAEQLGVSLLNIKLRSNLQIDSVRDALTGLHNRRYLEEALEREVYSAARQNRAIGVILLDIDHFRNFNNTFGHEAGDLVLKTLGGFLRRSLQKADLAARYGGEELMLVLPDSSWEETKVRAEQLREGVKHLNFEYSNQQCDRISVSIGMAIFPQNGMTREALLHSAEMALSRAKVEGRDRVCTPEG
ncbi:MULTISPECIES: PAS domain S-box protein [Spirulina sp. CCY15215]|uniref:PAS domain S-box protein n=1 Tax=Spirulina sp. CCY15215 TaxID=2767591 RepID=UPI00195163C9|nr:PAS domain S-box protein [Spirulina major]